MNDNRTGTVVYETPSGQAEAEGHVGIEESQMVTVVRVRGNSHETVIPWARVVRIDY